MMDKRWGKVQWGPDGERIRTSEAYWRQPLKWNREAEAAGVYRSVFCASLSDVFDNKAPAGARDDLWNLIRATPRLVWLLLTKRPQNIKSMLPDDWCREDEYHTWFGISAEDQTEFDRRWQTIIDDDIGWINFVSYEPALGPVRIRKDDWPYVPDWVIVGGESGPNARPMDPTWARDIIRDCYDAGVNPFLKQWGQYSNNPLVSELGKTIAEAREIDPLSNGKGGALLGGRLIREWPDVLAPPHQIDGSYAFPDESILIGVPND